MPRLGTGSEPSGGSGGGGGNNGGPVGSPQRRPAASAYPSGAMRGGFLSNLIFLLGITFILRNMIFNDYRTEEIEKLEASGKTREEIEKYVKSTSTERRKQENEQFKKQALLFEEVDALKEQVAEIRKILNLPDTSNNGTDSKGSDNKEGDGSTDKKRLRSRDGSSPLEKKDTKTTTKEVEESE